MKQYRDILRRVLSEGIPTDDRTGVGTMRVFGEQMRFDLRKGFPAVTYRQIPWRSAIAEQIGFMRGYNTVEQFEALGCKFWRANSDAWAGKKFDGDLGRIYGVQARDWAGHSGPLDQLKSVYDQIRTNPTSRRMVVSHWRPDELEDMALPPCHMFYQFYCDPENRLMSLQVYMRSNDLVLGTPANIVEYAWLLEVTAFMFDYIAHELVFTIGDAHIYNNHVEGVKEMLTRHTFAAPKLWIDPDAQSLMETYKDGREHQVFEVLEPKHFELMYYNHGKPIKFDMAV